MASKVSRKSGQPNVAQVMARMKPGPTRGRGRKSPLYLWLRTNHDRLLVEFEATSPSWGALAAALGEVGITNADNKPPTPVGARTTWYRVRRELADCLQPRLARAAEADASVPTIPPPERIGDNGKGAPRFRTVKLRNASDQPAPLAAAALKPPPAPEPAVNVDDVLSRFMPTTRRD
jgi:hypothetical protein